ncbi:MAG: AtpZ/AtpI family protein [Spirochaetes bacterium]|nr:AtpZ/AtpI family protein [Spirochaetota bacterium]
MKDKSSKRTVFANITVGMQFGITVSIFVYGGYRLDLYLNKSPLFVSIGAMLGMVIGFYNLMKELSYETHKEKEDRNKKRIRWM